KLGTQATTNIVISLVITAVLLGIIIPLLASTNPLFNNLVTNVMSSLQLDKLLQKILGDNLLVFVIRIILFLFFSFLLQSVISYLHQKPVKELKSEHSGVSEFLLIPKIVLSVVFAIFFITQLQLYFATPEMLKSLGYSNSQYAREVFAQLLVVAALIFGLVYADNNHKPISRLFTFILIIETIFLNLIALKSVQDYSSAWGLTHKRLYGYTFIVWLSGIIAFFTYFYTKDNRHALFLKRIFIYTGIVLIAVNIVNFDYLIYNFAKSTTHSGTDYYYLSSLSPDAKSYENEATILMKRIRNTKTPDGKDVEALARIERKLTYLREKYSKNQLRSWNYSEYKEYINTKDMDLNSIGSVVNVARQSIGLVNNMNGTITSMPVTGTPTEQATKISVTGTYTCLPHKDTTGPQTMECAFGIQTPDGSHYALRLEQPLIYEFKSGERVTVEGSLFPTEEGGKYDIKGVIHVEEAKSPVNL
ncbi:MAG: DUF4173 domain-containing protein, partial [Patescibacteria group bacterium]